MQVRAMTSNSSTHMPLNGTGIDSFIFCDVGIEAGGGGWRTPGPLR